MGALVRSQFRPFAFRTVLERNSPTIALDVDEPSGLGPGKAPRVGEPRRQMHRTHRDKTFHLLPLVLLRLSLSVMYTPRQA